MKPNIAIQLSDGLALSRDGPTEIKTGWEPLTVLGTAVITWWRSNRRSSDNDYLVLGDTLV
jgi:hypothetical protein